MRSEELEAPNSFIFLPFFVDSYEKLKFSNSPLCFLKKKNSMQRSSMFLQGSCILFFLRFFVRMYHGTFLYILFNLLVQTGSTYTLYVFGLGGKK